MKAQTAAVIVIVAAWSASTVLFLTGHTLAGAAMLVMAFSVGSVTEVDKW